MVVSIRSIGPQILLVGIHLLRAAGGDGGDLDTGALKGLWCLHRSRRKQGGGTIFRVMCFITGRLRPWFVWLKAWGSADDLGVGLHAMTMEANGLVVSDHRLGLAHI